jgi:signal transduction histidine kinase/DNA-binding response OmpR family regulator
MAKPGGAEMAGFFIAGLSPRLAFDADYRGFLDLAAAHVATGIANARAFEEEKQRAEALAELDRAKTAFFSNVSHEFRTPLTLMLGPLEDARRDEDEVLGPRTRDRVEVAHRNTVRLLRLVNTLLDFSRIEAGRMQAVYEDTDVCAFTEELASVFRSAFERAGLALEVSCRPLAAPVFVDREMWEKIVLNLLSNAFKFTLEGGVRVSLAPSGTDAVLSVQDTGIGIPPEDLERVFERFHRVQGARGRTHEGTGIGLALVKELVKLQGGTVRVESEVGRGTRFTVTIPTGTGHLPPDRIGTARTLSSTASGAEPYVHEALGWVADDAAPSLGDIGSGAADGGVATRGARVLLADDNADMRRYLKRLLSAYWQVEAVRDGEEALAAIRRDRPDLVLTDVMMPRRDGFSLLEAIRNDPATAALPVILLSARAGEEARVDGVDAGADDYLTKPFSARELVARVNGRIELARARREAQARLEEREALLAAVYTQLPVGLGVMDRTGRWVRTNAIMDRYVPQAIPSTLPERMRRWRAYDAEGNLVPPADWPGPRALRGEVVVGMEMIHTADDGTERWMSVSAAPLRDEAGATVGATAALVDVTDQKQAEQLEREELLALAERARAEAERANETKDNFLAVLSHELRSPMNAMLGWLRILRTAGTRDADLIGRAIDTLERNISIQAQIINDLLDVSRIMSGKLEIEETRVDLASTVTGCVESLRPSAEGKQVALRLELTANDIEVIGDGGRLQQVFSNLLGNAVKFTEAGGAITVRVSRAGETASVLVEDTGQGIEPEFLPHLFERFRQADDTKVRKHGGLGLGLAIVKSLVVLHGGDVRAESDGPGHGARFSVLLPIAEGRHRLAFRGPAPAGSPSTESLPALEVLLVEDDADSREALALALGESGGRVRSVDSVRRALEAYDASPPDVVISDVGMPGEDGYALIRAIREREEGCGRRTLAIAVTGFAGRQDREAALRAGFDDHVAKPIDVEGIIERVRVLEASRRASGGARPRSIS